MDEISISDVYSDKNSLAIIYICFKKHFLKYVGITRSQVLTGMCKYQSSGSNYKIMYFLTSDAKDISNMHLNFQSY